MNRLVPYLDLFERLGDGELARLAGVPDETARALRKQVDAVRQALSRYTDLLPRLQDAELMRLTGASAKTIRFWRLCQPRAHASAVPRPAPTPTAAPRTPEPSAHGTGDYASVSGGASAPRPTRPRPGRAQTTGSHAPTPGEAARRPGEASGIRPIAAPRPARPPAAEPTPSQLGVGGAPFPGYDHDPDNAAALDDDSEGIFLGLELPDSGQHEHK